MKICKKCKQTHEKQGDYCSRSCANSRGPRTQAFKDKVSKKLRTTFNKCVVCDNDTNGRRKTCSTECLTIVKQQNTPPKTPGGYRRGSGRGKHGWFKGYYLDSTYELAYLIYCLDHNIDIVRNTKYYEYVSEGKTKKYYPDFLVEGDLVEIKGYYVKDLDDKLSSVDRPIKVLFPEDLVDIFNYVSKKTGYKVKDLHVLYEN